MASTYLCRSHFCLSREWEWEKRDEWCIKLKERGIIFLDLILILKFFTSILSIFHRLYLLKSTPHSQPLILAMLFSVSLMLTSLSDCFVSLSPSKQNLMTEWPKRTNRQSIGSFRSERSNALQTNVSLIDVDLISDVLVEHYFIWFVESN